MVATSELMQWVERGDLARLQAALDQDGDPTARDSYGVSLLYLAAAKGDLAILELLIERGAEVDKTSDAGNSPLMVAAANGHLEALKLLLKKGASADRQNRWGQSAADWAQWAASPAPILDALEGRQSA